MPEINRSEAATPSTGSSKFTVICSRSAASPRGGRVEATIGGSLSSDTTLSLAANMTSGLVRRWFSTIIARVFSPFFSTDLKSSIS